MKIDNKKDKIKQNNQKDDQLLFETLLSGGTYSDYKTALQDRSMPQEKPQEITEDDVLQAWILGKDDESEQFASGGHMHQSYNSYLTRRDIENSVLNNPMFQQTSYVPDTSISGNLGFENTGLTGVAKPQGNPDIADNWSGWQAKGQYDPSKGAWQGAGNSIMSSAAIAGTLMDWDAGMYDNIVNRVDNTSNKIEAGINQVGAQNFGIGDTAYRASQYDNVQRAQNSSIEDNGGMSSGEGVLNGLKSIGQGAATGAQVGGLWGGIIGGIAGLGKGIGEWFLNRDAAERRMALNNLRAGIANSQVDQKFDLTNLNSNRLYNFSQLQQPYMAACGGKMKNRLASGGYINSHYDYITDPLVKVNAGGLHQENPNEGVQTSIAPDGQPNLVEEGETIINNGQEDAYVFSDRIVADDEILKAHLLPNKFAGKTYADISKELDKIIEEHKGSEIEERTFDEMTKRLQEAQEDQKYQEKAEEVAKFIDGLSDEQKEQLEQTMVEEAQAEQEQAMAEQQAMREQAAQEQAAQEQQAQPEQAPEQVVEQQEQAAPSRYDEMMSRAAITDAANGGMFGRGGHLHQTIGTTKRQPVYGTWNGFYDALFNNKPLVSAQEPKFDSKYFIGSRKITPDPNVFYEDGSVAKLRFDSNGNKTVYYPVEGSSRAFVQDDIDRESGRYIGNERKTTDNIYADINNIKGYSSLNGTQIAPDYSDTDYWMPSVNTRGSVIANDNTDNQATTTKTLTNTGKSTVAGNAKKPSNYPNKTNTPMKVELMKEPSYRTGYLDNGLTNLGEDRLYGTEDDTYNAFGELTTKPSVNEKDIVYGLYDKYGGKNPENEHGFNWLRYAPAIGSGLQHLSDLLGITNRPDYTNANMYQRSINGIPTINYLPIGSYINYSPIDETYQQNQLRQQMNAARRAAIVNGGGNAGAALAALNAIGYNESNALGDLGIRVADYNNQMGQKVAEHNLRINQINASNSLSAQEKNQAIAAEKARLTYNLAQMRQQIEDQNDIAKAMNYNNLMTNLGNIGREEFIMNQINDNPAYYYSTDRAGHITYKQAFYDQPQWIQDLIRERAEQEGETKQNKKGK